MRFSAIGLLNIQCFCEQFVPGALHPDGQRYLPQIIVRPIDAGPDTAPDTRLWLVDRHHRVDPALAGQMVIARLLCALSAIRLQTLPPRAGFVPPPGAPAGLPLSEPIIYGRVAQVLTWEVQREHLPFETLYTELVIALSPRATLGLRTTLSAPRIADLIGKSYLAVGDWIEIARSRIDILTIAAAALAVADDAWPARNTPSAQP